MYKYRYTGSGVMTFTVDGKRITVGFQHPRLPNIVELQKKVDVAGLELVDDKKNKKGDG